MNPELHFAANVAALVFFGALLWWRLRRQPLTFADGVDSAVYLVVGLLVGAWLANALPRLADTLLGGARYEPWWAAGQHWIGAVAGGSVGGYLWLRRRRLPAGFYFDAAAPAVALALAVVRIGCWVNGDSFGRETDSWIGMWLPDADGHYAMRYPTQLISLAASVLIGALLLGFEWFTTQRMGEAAEWPFPGFLFLLYVVLYCLQRIFFEFWRADMYPLAGPFTWTHLYCVVSLALAGWAIGRGVRQGRVATDFGAR